MTLVANSRRRPTGRSLGRIGYPGERKPRFPTAEMNSPPVSPLVLTQAESEGLYPGAQKPESQRLSKFKAEWGKQRTCLQGPIGPCRDLRVSAKGCTPRTKPGSQRLSKFKAEWGPPRGVALPTMVWRAINASRIRQICY